MKQGDFSKLAKEYKNRTGYSFEILKMIYAYIGIPIDIAKIADIGAGTGKLTEQLLEMGFKGFAVEPNDQMRSEGIKQNEYGKKIIWSKGFGEETGLADNSVDWVFMASSFHWTDHKKSIPEFHRILKPGGYFTALWNPRNLVSSKLHMRIEEKINNLIPDLKRISSGGKKYTEGLEEKLLFNDYFGNLIFTEADHNVEMTKSRYMGAWKSVNDIQAQAGEDRWLRVLDAISNEIIDLDLIIVPYKTRAWTVKAKNL
tara:strand:- start:4167 stop:4937 length:771 start_codon:yes stop_codon:yes gene_type:complete